MSWFVYELSEEKREDKERGLRQRQSDAWDLEKRVKRLSDDVNDQMH